METGKDSEFARVGIDRAKMGVEEKKEVGKCETDTSCKEDALNKPYN
jgi:hypothetical protein